MVESCGDGSIKDGDFFFLLTEQLLASKGRLLHKLGVHVPHLCYFQIW
jgi:hypothetical protein